MGDTRLSIPELMTMKSQKRPITMLSIFDYQFAIYADRAGIDIMLVGDSLGNVMLGYENTLPVNMEEMLHHAKAVVRGRHRALVIADMPFLSYQCSVEEAISNAGMLIKEAGVDGVKVEGGSLVAPIVRAIVNAGIPVMGHVGLTPQTVNQMGGYRVQGRDMESARRVYQDAIAIQEAGAFVVALECIPSKLAALITSRLRVPTIGLGCGSCCDGQTLIGHDLLGMYDRHVGKFVKQYASIGTEIVDAFTRYKEDVLSKKFPEDRHTYAIDEDVIAQLVREEVG